MAKLMTLQFRPAQASDAAAAIPLIYSAGPEAFEYGFSLGEYRAQQFLAQVFPSGKGFFGWQNHHVVLREGQVVGIGAFYSAAEYAVLSRQLMAQALAYYPLPQWPRFVHRALQLKGLMPAPKANTQYVANLGVCPSARSQGVGAALLTQQKMLAQQAGKRVYALDVSMQNPRAQALYQRLGFVPSGNQYFRGPAGAVPDSCRLTMPLP